ncbi:MAG TPA: (2Fe-2S) ferredoxin domain-containing protein [Pilimelia sp.]|nr:(2Fe-2S) ferredoxin domain-containing protein [Pilimelia sp.]
MTAAAAAPAGVVGVIACRGCCCGNPAKEPGVDHDGELAALRRAAAASGGAVTVRTSDCLGPCADRNVIVVRPSRAGRRAGGRPTWFGRLDPAGVAALARWAAAGGPGLVPVPAPLRAHAVTPGKTTAEADAVGAAEPTAARPA